MTNPSVSLTETSHRMPGKQGFASMSAERRREICVRGGKASQANGHAHRWTTDEAKANGRKGGQISRGGKGRLPADRSDVRDDVT